MAVNDVSLTLSADPLSVYCAAKITLLHPRGSYKILADYEVNASTASDGNLAKIQMNFCTAQSCTNLDPYLHSLRRNSCRLPVQILHGSNEKSINTFNNVRRSEPFQMESSNMIYFRNIGRTLHRNDIFGPIKLCMRWSTSAQYTRDIVHYFTRVTDGTVSIESCQSMRMTQWRWVKTTYII